MANDTIREFLVGIGYKVDEPSKRRFTDGLAVMTKRVAEVATAVEAAAVAVRVGVAKMASGMEALYYSSRRLGSSAEDIQAFGFAVGQMGGSADGARSSLEALATKLRFNPGYGGLLASLGVQGRDAVSVMQQLSVKFREMPLFQAHAYAGALGIDDRTLMAMIDGVGKFGAVYQDMYRKAGINSKQATADAHGFMNELRTLDAAFDILEQKVASKLTKGMGEDIRRFRILLVANFDRIAHVVEVASRVILMIADAVWRMIMRASQGFDKLAAWFSTLSPNAQKLIKELGLLLVAWRLLNSGFMATPLGIITALIASLLLLYDDYQTWKEGGKSLIDWAKWEPGIKSAIAALKEIGHWLNDNVGKVGGWQTVLEALAVYVAGAWLIKMLAGFGGAAKGVSGLTSALVLLAAAVGMKSGSYLADVDENPQNHGWFGNAVINMRHWLGTDKQTDPHPGLTWLMRAVGINVSPHDANDQIVPTGGSDGQAAHRRSAAINYMMKAHGWSLAAASGIVANLSEESGLNTNDVGDNGAAHGIAQWHADRQAAIESHFGKPLASMSLPDQLDAVDWELRNGPDAGMRKAGRLLSSPGLETGQAAADFSVLGERSSDPNKDASGYGDFTRRRIALARRLAEVHNSQPVAPPSPTATPTYREPGGVTVNSTNNVTIHGAGDPHSTAHAVGREVAHQNANLVRNTAGAVQ